jgi:hypothetical protein
VSEDKPAIALVHGAFADSASWNAVIELQERSFDVTAVSNPWRSVAGDAYVRDVIAGIGSGPVVLVGHS